MNYNIVGVLLVLGLFGAGMALSSFSTSCSDFSSDSCSVEDRKKIRIASSSLMAIASAILLIAFLVIYSNKQKEIHHYANELFGLGKHSTVEKSGSAFGSAFGSGAFGNAGESGAFGNAGESGAFGNAGADNNFGDSSSFGGYSGFTD
jgi:hypothetical protein